MDIFQGEEGAVDFSLKTTRLTSLMVWLAMTDRATAKCGAGQISVCSTCVGEKTLRKRFCCQFEIRVCAPCNIVRRAMQGRKEKMGWTRGWGCNSCTRLRMETSGLRVEQCGVHRDSTRGLAGGGRGGRGLAGDVTSWRRFGGIDHGGETQPWK